MPAPGATSQPATSPAPAASAPARPFPPPDIRPPFERSKAPGDGRWTPLAARPGAVPSSGAPVMVTTTLHPHRESRFMALTLVAVDLTRASLHFMPGTADVKQKELPFAPGLVPQQEQARLLAAFNGGFMPRHGRYGMRLGEVSVLPPRKDACTIAIGRDGSVKIRSVEVLEASLPEALAVRQTPPCLLEQGVVHPLLEQGRDKAWAGHTPGVVTRRRSAIGLDATGLTLFYAVGIETSAKLLAEGMRFAGASDAAELDINWNWTKFFTFARGEDGSLVVGSTLVPVEHAKSAYVGQASDRDFFYLLSR